MNECQGSWPHHQTSDQMGSMILGSDSLSLWASPIKLNPMALPNSLWTLRVAVMRNHLLSFLTMLSHNALNTGFKTKLFPPILLFRDWMQILKASSLCGNGEDTLCMRSNVSRSEWAFQKWNGCRGGCLAFQNAGITFNFSFYHNARWVPSWYALGIMVKNK